MLYYTTRYGLGFRVLARLQAGPAAAPERDVLVPRLPVLGTGVVPPEELLLIRSLSVYYAVLYYTILYDAILCYATAWFNYTTLYYGVIYYDILTCYDVL